MSKTTPRSTSGRRTGTVTVIEAKVHRSSQRHARFAFIITAILVGLVTMIVASATMHPILAAFFGAAVGAPSGALVWVLFRIWPVIRLVWWWFLEIAFVTAVMYGWVQLAQHTPMWVRFVVVGLVVGVPALIPAVRRRLIAVGWCVIVRHRLRVCFTQFIVSNQSGSLPLILWARPTPVGERVWVYLRPGLSVADLQGRLDKIAVACHASTVLVERASEGNSAYLRFDIKRREVLTANVGSPLVDAVDPTAPKVPRQPATVPTALDLPDVTDVVIPLTPKPAARTAATAASAAPANGKKPAAPAEGAAGDDITDWI